MKHAFLYGAHVRANGIRQHYLRYGGSGTPLILVPGIISPAAIWGFVGERLGRVFDTYILDVRGRGLSESGPQLDYSLDACAEDVVALAQALELRNCILLGHSMGARIAVRAACRMLPGIERFQRLVLADPPVSGPGRRPYPSPLDGMLKLLGAARRGEAEPLLRAPNASRWPETLLRLRAEWLHTCDERAVVASYEGFHKTDLCADLPQVRMPVSLIAAGKGDVIRPEEEQELRRAAPSMVSVRVANAGHQIPVDDLEGFLEAIESVLNIKLDLENS